MAFTSRPRASPLSANRRALHLFLESESSWTCWPCDGAGCEDALSVQVGTVTWTLCLPCWLTVMWNGASGLRWSKSKRDLTSDGCFAVFDYLWISSLYLPCEFRELWMQIVSWWCLHSFAPLFFLIMSDCPLQQLVPANCRRSIFRIILPFFKHALLILSASEMQSSVVSLCLTSLCRTAFALLSGWRLLSTGVPITSFALWWHLKLCKCFNSLPFAIIREGLDF